MNTGEYTMSSRADKLLKEITNTWESLPAGQYTVPEIQRWIMRLHKVMEKIREYENSKVPKG